MKNCFLFVILSAFIVAGFSSCSSCSHDKKSTQFTAFEQSMSTKDSVEVANLVAIFFEYVKQHKYYDAAGMLYTYNDDRKTADPQPLDNEKMNSVKNMLEFLHPADYKINFMKFEKYYDNEVECTLFLKEHVDGEPDVKSKMYFKPFKYMDKWVLMLVDSHEGRQPIVDNNKRDSVQKSYNQRKSATLKQNPRN